MKTRHPYYAEIDALKERTKALRRMDNRDAETAIRPILASLLQHPLWAVAILVDPIWEDTSLGETRTSASMLNLDLNVAAKGFLEGTFDYGDDGNDLEKTIAVCCNLEMHAALGQAVRAERAAAAGVLPPAWQEGLDFWNANK